MDDWDRPSGRPLREIPREGTNHAFLLKALGEAAHELEREFYGIRKRQLNWRDGDEWSLRQIAGHLRDNEEQTLAYLRAILSSRAPLLEVTDLAAEAEERGQRVNVEDALSCFAEARQEVLYLLYGLSDRQWRRSGEHPYRGALDIARLVHELNEHDLGHLWQIQKTKQRLPGV